MSNHRARPSSPTLAGLRPLGAGFSTPLEDVCALCGTRATAAVPAQGVGTSTTYYGAGGSGEQAQSSAAYAAQANAVGAPYHAPCPRRGGHQPIVRRWSLRTVSCDSLDDHAPDSDL